MKPKNGTIVSRNGVEFQYQDGVWYPTKSKGWTANATISKELMSKWMSGDYKVWDSSKEKYVQGAPPNISASDALKLGIQKSKKESAEMPSIGLGLNDKFPKVFGSGATQTGFNPRESKAGASETKAGSALIKKSQAGTGATGNTTRELQTEQGIKTTKPTLEMTQEPALRTQSNQPTYSTYQKQGLKGMLGNMFKGNEGAESSKFGEYASYLPDVFNLFMGMKGASEKLPKFEVPSSFTDYENRMRELSYQGLTAEELSTARRDLERSYAYDVNAIGQFAGGRPGVALANLGRAASSYQGGLNALNVANAQMQRSNLANYGNVVGTRLGLEQADFNLRYQQAMQNKMAGAQLAADALSNMQSRYDYQKAYGTGSVYDQYQKSLLEGQKYQNEILKYQLENPVDLNTIQFAPTALPNAPTAATAQQFPYFSIGGFGSYNLYTD